MRCDRLIDRKKKSRINRSCESGGTYCTYDTQKKRLRCESWTCNFLLARPYVYVGRARLYTNQRLLKECLPCVVLDVPTLFFTAKSTATYIACACGPKGAEVKPCVPCARACNCQSHRLTRYSVDIDRACFGHQVVEIEQMASPSMADIEAARDSIAALARSLGARREGASGLAAKVRGGHSREKIIDLRIERNEKEGADTANGVD